MPVTDDERERIEGNGRVEFRAGIVSPKEGLVRCFVSVIASPGVRVLFGHKLPGAVCDHRASLRGFSNRFWKLLVQRLWFPSRSLRGTIGG